MNVSAKVALATVLSGLALGASPAAMAATHYAGSNAVDKCRPYAPGQAGAIRSRVLGLENVGTKPVLITCAFETDAGNNLNTVVVNWVEIALLNNSSTSVSVTCTLLPGSYWGAHDIGSAQTQTTTINPGGNYVLLYVVSDNVNAVGVTCNLPAGAMLAGTNINYTSDT